MISLCCSLIPVPDAAGQAVTCPWTCRQGFALFALPILSKQWRDVDRQVINLLFSSPTSAGYINYHVPPIDWSAPLSHAPSLWLRRWESSGRQMIIDAGEKGRAKRSTLAGVWRASQALPQEEQTLSASPYSYTDNSLKYSEFLRP